MSTAPADDADLMEPPASLPALLQDSALPRPALQRRLRELLRRQQVLCLNAPAGFGKTMALVELMRSWMAEAEDGRSPPLALSWFSARPGNDVARLCAGWCLGLEPYDLPWRRSPQALLRALDGQPGPLTAFVDALLQALQGLERGEGVLVVDDLHCIVDDSLPLLLELLTQRLPSRWKLVVASRTQPMLPGETLQASALRFTPQEVGELLAQHSALAAGAADGLWQATQGWPAAVSLWRRLHPGAYDTAALASLRRDHLFEELAQEALDGLPAAAQALVLRCALLPVWSVQRCAAVSHDPQASRWLQLLETRGLFVRRAPGLEPAWVMHDLLRDFLQERLMQQHAQELPMLLLRAADTEPDPDQRVAYLLRAGMLERAALALMDAASGLLARGELAKVQRLLDAFPVDEAVRLPSWQFVRGRLAELRWDWPVVESAMAAARTGFLAEGWEEMATLAGVLQAQGRTGMARLDEADELLQSLRLGAMGPTGQIIRDGTLCWLHAARGPREAMVKDMARIVDGLAAGAPIELWTQCVPNLRFATMSGMAEGLDRFIALALAVAGDEALPLRLSVRLLSGWLAVARGDLTLALADLELAQADANWIGLPGQQQWTHACLVGKLAALRGDREGVNATMAPVVARYPSGNPWRRTVTYFWMRLAECVGDEDTVRQLNAHLLSAEADSDGEWPFSRELKRLAQARALLAQGQGAAARDMLRDVMAALEDIDNIGIRGYAAATLALACADAALMGEAQAALRTALHAAVPYVPTLALLGRARLQRIEALARQGGLDAALQAPLTSALALLEAAQREHPTGEPARTAALADLLTSREIEVLARMAAGESNKVIARVLDLSPHTVKRHVANIFDKLAVSTRAQAAVIYQARSG